MAEYVYVVVHRVTYENGNPGNYDDSILGVYKDLSVAKAKVDKYCHRYYQEDTSYEKASCCDKCVEVYAKEGDYGYSGERCSVYKCFVHRELGKLTKTAR